MIQFKVECLEEHLPIESNLVDSGDKDLDQQEEQKVINDFNSGNPWAWCTIKVTAFIDGCPVKGVDYLGGCSYKSEDDFKKDGYYEDMCQQAKDDLLNQFKNILSVTGIVDLLQYIKNDQLSHGEQADAVYITKIDQVLHGVGL